MKLFSKFSPANRLAKKEARERREAWAVFHNRGTFLAAPLSQIDDFPFPGGRECWSRV